jgi:hypothetical protein
MKTLICALAMATIASTTIWAAEEEAYIDVEIKGTLETGILAIGGETTGTMIKVGKVTWELDLGGKKELQELAEKLNKQQVLVTGRYQQKQGVEVRVRHIVTVKTLKGAKDK